MNSIKNILNRTSLILACAGIIACAGSRVQHTYIGNWQETHLPYTESFRFQENNDLLGLITVEKWCCGSHDDYQWLRQEHNLSQTFNTLKKIGLKRFISETEFNRPLFNDAYWNYDWEGLSLNDVVKRMIYAYDERTDTSDYFQKFWSRRRAENNDSIVFEILKEIDVLYNQDTHHVIVETIMDTQMYQLIRYNVELNESDSSTRPFFAKQYFNYLKASGLDHSAYNLIYELDVTKDIGLNADSMRATLRFDTITETQYWATRNQATWIRTYRDNGP